jgi:hypothetical protein
MKFMGSFDKSRNDWIAATLAQQCAYHPDEASTTTSNVGWSKLSWRRISMK